MIPSGIEPLLNVIARKVSIIIKESVNKKIQTLIVL